MNAQLPARLRWVLSNDEYWSASAWTRIDVNLNGRIDSNDWM